MTPPPPVSGRYVRSTTIDPVTGACVRVLDLGHPASEFPQGRIVDQRDMAGQVVKSRVMRWGTHCVEHGTVAEHLSLVDATAVADDSADWCGSCRGSGCV